MAKHKDGFLFGRVGNMVFYEMNGKQFVRSRPVQKRRSAALAKRMLNFGLASRLSSIYLSEIGRLLELPKFPELHSKFTGVITQWLGRQQLEEIISQLTIPLFNRFQINPQAKQNPFWSDLFKTKVDTGGKLQLTITESVIPPFDIAPTGTSVVTCCCVVVNCSLNGAAVEHCLMKTIDIPLTHTIIPAQFIELDVTPRAGDLVIVVTSLLFKGRTHDTLEGLKEWKWRPVEIIGAVYR